MIREMKFIMKMMKNVIKTRSVFLGVLATMYEIFDHRWIEGVLTYTCDKSYSVVITHYVKNEKIGSLRIKTCVQRDLGS
ncbi:MAG: hypothetical protein QW632_04440 [Ignisphaera sp.]